MVNGIFTVIEQYTEVWLLTVEPVEKVWFIHELVMLVEILISVVTITVVFMVIEITIIDDFTMDDQITQNVDVIKVTVLLQPTVIDATFAVVPLKDLLRIRAIRIIIVPSLAV